MGKANGMSTGGREIRERKDDWWMKAQWKYLGQVHGGDSMG